MAGEVVYLYGCVTLLVPECTVYRCIYVCETYSKVALKLTFQVSTFIVP